MTRQWCGEDHEHTAIVASEACGCVAGVSVITHSEAEAYQFAAKEAKAGLVITTRTSEAMRTMDWTCAAHPDGPPWWKSRGGNGRRPKAPTVEMGL